jgi:DNA-binding transcriptional LysR family regulator
MADLGSKRALLLEGIGWGNMPLPMVASDLASGRLVCLNMPDHRAGTYRFAGIHRTDTLPGPAATWLLRRFASFEVAASSDPQLADVD